MPLGPIVLPTTVENAVEATLRQWMPQYIAHLGRQEGLDPDTLATPRSWRHTNEQPQLWPDDDVPAMFVVSQGDGDVTRDGDGWQRSVFDIHVAAIVIAADRESTNALAKLYAGAIAASIAQNGSLGGVATATYRRGGTWDIVPDARDRTIAGCELMFDVHVDRVLNTFDGLSEPTAGDPPVEPENDPTIASHEITIDQIDQQTDQED